VKWTEVPQKKEIEAVVSVRVTETAGSPWKIEEEEGTKVETKTIIKVGTYGGGWSRMLMPIPMGVS